MRTFRLVVQATFLLLFFTLFLQTETKGGDELGYPVKVFLDCDPLIFISTLFSSRALSPGFPFALMVILATVALGRVFCGWVCPLGTLSNLIRPLRNRPPALVSPHWYRLKYYLLIFLLASSVCTLQITGILDPLSLLIRSLSVSVYPALNFAVRSVFETMYELNVPVITPASEFLYRLLKQFILAFHQPIFRQSFFIGILFLGILILNLVQRRFWCKYICPLGAFLGVLSHYSLLRRSVSEGCDSCEVCSGVCQGGANPQLRDQWKSTECIYCMDCDDLCPQGAVSFGFSRKSPHASLNLGRRNVILSMVSGVVVVSGLRIGPSSRTTSVNPKLIRPPGSLDEREFLRRCIRCGECMKVCITNGLQPTFLDAGLEGIWTPELIPRMGHCEYRCTLCGQVCPTGAISRLTLEEKQQVRIGLAFIDRGRCLPYAHATPCLVCQEVCPTPKKAIWLGAEKVKNREGKEISLKQPKVDLTLCVGCGICEAKCPVTGEPAIYVINTGESRSEENQLLLP